MLFFSYYLSFVYHLFIILQIYKKDLKIKKLNLIFLIYKLNSKNKRITMTQIIKLNNHPDNLVEYLQNKELLIYEDIQGAQIFVRWNGTKFVIKPKSINNTELNFVDLAIQKFYNLVFVYLSQLPDYVTNLLSPNWWFCFEYFPDLQPAHIEYKKMPLNNLILTCIVKGTKYKYNYSEIEEYAKLFNVDSLPVIFRGKLNEKQLEVINLFLHTSEHDLDYVFSENNFAYFFYKILNPKMENSFLMDEFNDNLEKIIIRINGNDEFSFEILNPSYEKMNLDNKTEYLETYSLILLNFLEFLQIVNLEKIKLKEITKDELYIELISTIFNEYIENIKKEITNWNLSIPEFFSEDKFKINTFLLKNKMTIGYIKSDNKIEYIFKLILSSFNKHKNKPIGIFNEKTLELFNSEVDTISNFLDGILKINREYLLRNSDLLNFKDYFKISYNTDADGEIYPDVDQLMSDIPSGGEKKKKEGSPKKGEVPDFTMPEENLKKPLK